jgi:hypothetical protein
MEEKRKKLRKEAQAKGQDPNKVIVSHFIQLEEKITIDGNNSVHT